MQFTSPSQLPSQDGGSETRHRRDHSLVRDGFLRFLSVVVLITVISGLLYHFADLAAQKTADGAKQYLAEYVERLPGKMVREVRDAFMEVAQVRPRIIAESRVVAEQGASAFQLTVMHRTIVIERDTSSAWLGSRKRLRLRGLYKISGGYDLTAPWTVAMAERSLEARIPEAQIVACETLKVEVLEWDNGMWNKVTPVELEQEIAALGIDAKKRALDDGLREAVEKELATRLRQRLPTDWSFRITRQQTAENAL